MKRISTFVSKVFVILILSFSISWCSWSQDATHLHFDGTDDYVTCGNILPASYTKEAWINITNAGVRNNIISGGTDGRHAFWAPVDFGNRLSAGHNDVWDLVQDATPLALNTWYHVAVTYDAVTGTMKLYKNGLLVDSATGVPAYAGTNVVRLGAYDMGGNIFQGSIDEVRIWNIVLAADEIAARKNCELNGNEPGLVAYYRFNQGLDAQPNPGITILTDATTNGNNGTLNNFALTGSTSNWLAGSPVTTGIMVPAAPVASPQSLCIGSTVADLTATGTGTITWYNTATGGSPLGAGTLLTTGTYYCAAVNASGCESARTAVAVTVNSGTLGLNAAVVASNDCVSGGTLQVTQQTLLSADFTALPPGATLTGNAVVNGGECVLTTNVNGQQGTVTFAGTAYKPAPLNVSFSFFTGGGSGADGFSFNYGVLPPGYVDPLGNEYGVATSGLVIRFIEYGTSRVQLVYNNSILSSVNFALNTNIYKTCSFNINDNGAITLTIGGTTIFNNISISGYTAANRSSWQFAFSGRTGGLNNIHKIDNVLISTPLPTLFSIDSTTWQPSPTFAGLLPGTYTVLGKNSGPGCPEVLGFDVVATPDISAVPLAGSYQTVTGTQSSITDYGNCTGLIASIQSNGASPISGSTTATVWIESTQPAQYVQRHFEITPAANAATATGRVTLYFTQAEFDAFNAVSVIDLPTGPADAAGIANLLIEKRSGTSSNATGLPPTYTGSITTIDPADGDIVWNALNNRWEISFDVTGFSGFFVKTSSFTLPVTLVSFSASKQPDGDVEVHWKTTGEQNLSHYEIERSYNGSSFEHIGSVNARNTVGSHEYSYIDNSEWQQATRYYRLKVIDIDGSYRYSDIVRLVNEQKGSINLYPNPAGKMVTVQVTDARLLYTQATIVDGNGRIVRRIYINSTRTSVPVAHLAGGIYWLRFADGSVIKLIKE